MELSRTSWNTKEYEEFKRFLEESKDEDYFNFHSKLVPGCVNIIGIRVPVLKDIAKKIAKGNYKEFLKLVDDDYYETTMIHGLIIGFCKADYNEKTTMLKNFVPKINNWAICDCVCATLKFVNKSRGEFLEFLKQYVDSKEEFELRFAIVMLMDYYITEEYIDYVLDVLKNTKHEAYYVKMAVAWNFSVCFVKFEDKTMDVLLKGNIDKDVLRKSFQKIVESNRVDKDKKDYIRTLRKTMC